MSCIIVAESVIRVVARCTPLHVMHPEPAYLKTIGDMSALRREETERFEDRKMGRPSSGIIFLALIFLSIAEC